MKQRRKAKRGISLILAASMVLAMLSGSLVVQAESVDPPAAFGPTPSESQLKYHNDELSAFVHFGVNTFTGRSWGDGTEDPNIFNPTDLDADQWVKTMKDAGFQKLIMIAKHHDGFCLWQSDVTEHDVGSSTDWQTKMGGTGDVLLEVSKACTKYDIDMGIYLSPWDQNATCYGYGDGAGDDFSVPEGDYNLYYEAQLRELLSGKYGNNGKVAEVWMDGAKGTGQAAQDYRFTEWFDLIEELQPGCLVFSPYASTVRWIGNESGIAGDPCWSKVDQQRVRDYFNIHGGDEASYLNSGDANGDIWSVGECDVSVTSGWFWVNGQTPKPMATLTNIYFNSVGHGCPLLLNVPPNTDGKFQQNFIDRIAEFGQTVRESFQTDLAKGADVTASASAVRGGSSVYAAAKAVDGDPDTYWTMDDGVTTGTLTIDLGESKTFDVVSIEEYIPLGQRISSFQVDVHTQSGWQSFGSGKTIGAKRLVRNLPVKADQVRITIDSSKAVPLISNVGVFKASGEFALGSAMPDGLSLIDNVSFTNTGTWHSESPAGAIAGTSMWSAVTGSASSFTFTGTKAWVFGTKDPNHGVMEVWIDGNKADEANTQNTSRQLAQLLYTTPDLEYGQHTVKLVVKQGDGAKGAVGLDAAYYLDNKGAGMFELEPVDYTVGEGDAAKITIKRVGGSAGEVTVTFDTTPGTATDGRDYREVVNHTVTFADGQDTAVVEVATVDNENTTEDLSFYCELSNPAGGAILGLNPRGEVTILDNDGDREELLAEAREKQEGVYTGDSWSVFREALERAEAAMADPNATAAQKSEALADLNNAMDALRERTGYTGEDPFVFPSVTETTKLVEAEHLALVPTTDNYVRVSEDSAASGGKKIGWFEPGNQIKLPYTAAKAGTYTFQMTYQSGRTEANPNVLRWSGDAVVSGSYTVPGSGTQQPIPFLTGSFDIEITEPGAGEIIFTAGSEACPNIDKFEVTVKELKTVTYTIEATAGEGGSISPAGPVKVEENAAQTFSFVPNDGYRIADVKVNGASVGKPESYTFENVTADASIEVSFEEAARPEEGLVGYWNFDQPSATSVPNQVSADFAGTLNGTGVRIEENGTLSGGMLHLTGEDNSYLNIPGLVNSATDTFSVSFWMNLDESINDGRTVNINLLQQSGGGRTLLYYNTSNLFGTFINSSDVLFDASPELGKWQHIVLSSDVATHMLQLYVDGALVKEVSAGSTGGVDALTDLIVGCHKNGSGPVKGDLDELRYYSRTLDAQEVAALYEQNAPGQPGLTASLSGTVRDEAGVPIEGATVTLTAAEDGDTPLFTVTTDAQGAYRFNGVGYGSYTVTAEKDGKTASTAAFTVDQSEVTAPVLIITLEEPLPADKTELEKILVVAGGYNLDDYVDTEAFVSALAAAQATSKKENASQEEVNRAVYDLLMKMAGLRQKADQEHLDAWLEQLKNA